ncbi:hypothetical protein LQW54_002517 [Pestalotiopsis sp. IQ-011]
MNFFYSLSILAIGATLGLAAPSSEPGLSTSNLGKRQCDSQNADCGTCNGTSCKIGLYNYDCSEGSCTSQSGAGDGSPCDRSNSGYVRCPGR